MTNSKGSTDHDRKTEPSITVRGAGALRGRLTLEKSVDLTKPIASQVLPISTICERAARKDGS